MKTMTRKTKAKDGGVRPTTTKCRRESCPSLILKCSLPGPCDGFCCRDCQKKGVQG